MTPPVVQVGLAVSCIGCSTEAGVSGVRYITPRRVCQAGAAGATHYTISVLFLLHHFTGPTTDTDTALHCCTSCRHLTQGITPGTDMVSPLLTNTLQAMVQPNIISMRHTVTAAAVAVMPEHPRAGKTHHGAAVTLLSSLLVVHHAIIRQGKGGLTLRQAGAVNHLQVSQCLWPGSCR